MADLLVGLSDARPGLICQPVGRAICPWPRPLRRRMLRWIDHASDQSLLMAPIDQILAALSDLWAALATPMTEIGTEVY